jgi:hypothetical protein
MLFDYIIPPVHGYLLKDLRSTHTNQAANTRLVAGEVTSQCCQCWHLTIAPNTKQHIAPTSSNGSPPPLPLNTHALNTRDPPPTHTHTHTRDPPPTPFTHPPTFFFRLKMSPGSTSPPPAAMADSTAARTAPRPTYRMLVLAGKAEWSLPSCRGWSLMPRRSNSADVHYTRQQCKLSVGGHHEMKGNPGEWQQVTPLCKWKHKHC